MATHIFFTLKSHFTFVYDSYPAAFIRRTMLKFCGFVWVLLCHVVSSSFRHLIEHLAGSRDDHHEKSLGPTAGFNEQEEMNQMIVNSEYSIFDGFDEDEKSEFTFGFQYQLKEEDLITADKGTGKGTKTTPEVKLEKTEDFNALTTKTTTSKYEFMSVHDFGSFVSNPEPASFTVQELFVETPSMEDKDNLFPVKEKATSQNSVKEEQKEEEEEEGKLNVQSDEKVHDLSETEVSSCKDDDEVEELQNLQEKSEKIEFNLGENSGLKTEQGNWLGEFITRTDNFCYGFDFDLSQRSDFDSPDSQDESDDSGDGFFSISPQDDEPVIEPEPERLIPPFQEPIESINSMNSMNSIDDDYIELEPDQETNLINSNSNSNSNAKYEYESIESDSGFAKDLSSNAMESEYEPMNSWEFDSDEEEDEDPDVLLEHEELISQMKMELKNARTGGLPTILEECETPRLNEDYKPLQINEKLEHRDLMAEIQKFNKTYTEKMRKLDVLNYQTLQAINFLKMKHPEQINTGENTSLSAIKSVLLPSLWPCKLRRIYADPTLKSITELHKDLEIVYVGQACLSWEILHWQYKKAKELQLYDPQGYRSYNQVAIEFQQFYVLLKRFTEDELFQGPRVLNYTKQRCTVRGLLQVPAVKDDNLKEKKARKQEEEDAVSASAMAKMIKESMMVFWDFLHTDKDTTNLFLTIILQGSKAHLQDPADSDLFMEVKTTHQKKDKRLKDMLRTGNCIVKKFQKQQETVLDQHMFVAQVELRLVSRVLSLPRLSREQLLWCQSKLNHIKFIDRKIQVEDSLFLLFPC